MKYWMVFHGLWELKLVGVPDLFHNLEGTMTAVVQLVRGSFGHDVLAV